MFSSTQLFICGIVILVIGYLVIYGSSSKEFREGLDVLCNDKTNGPWHNAKCSSSGENRICDPKGSAEHHACVDAGIPWIPNTTGTWTLGAGQQQCKTCGKCGPGLDWFKSWKKDPAAPGLVAEICTPTCSKLATMGLCGEDWVLNDDGGFCTADSRWSANCGVGDCQKCGKCRSGKPNEDGTCPPATACSDFAQKNCDNTPFIGKIWNPNPAATDKTCEDGTNCHDVCCLSTLTCSSFNSSSCLPGTHLGNNPTKVCAGAECQSSDCCVANPTCANFSGCTNGATHVGNPAKVCAGETCTSGECCVNNPKCTGNVDCTVGQYLNDPTKVCAGAKCNKGECCADNAMCTSIEGCIKGRQFKPNYKQIRCAGGTCKDAECCDPIPQPTCNDFSCPTHSSIIKNAKDKTCAGAACTDNECCTQNPKPTCYGDEMKCPQYYYLKSNYQTIQCDDYSCNISECCSPNPTCDTIQCSPGFTGKAASTTCKGSTCLTSECCNVNEKCSSFKCPTGYIANPHSPTDGCVTTQCTINECCILQPPKPSKPPTIINEEEDINIYFPDATFITFDNDRRKSCVGDSKKKNTDISKYSEYDNWTSPKSVPNFQTNNMFSNRANYKKWGIGAFNTASYNQA